VGLIAAKGCGVVKVGDSCGGGDGGALVWSSDGGNGLLYAVGWLGLGLLMGMTEKKWSQIEKRNLFI
jgi:hypothetical protein